MLQSQLTWHLADVLNWLGCRVVDIGGKHVSNLESRKGTRQEVADHKLVADSCLADAYLFP